MCRHAGCPSPSDTKNACVTCGGWFCSPEHLAEHVDYYRSVGADVGPTNVTDNEEGEV